MTTQAEDTPMVSIRSTHDLARALEDFIRRNPNIMGGADIYLLDLGDPAVRAGILAATLVSVVDGDKRRAAEALVILCPPERDADAIQASARQGFLDAYRIIAPTVDLENAGKWFDLFARVEVAPDRRSSSVLTIAKGLSPRTAMIVHEAGEYRDDAVEVFVPDGASGPLLPEDLWAPQLHALARSIVEAIAGLQVHVAFDTHRPHPVREALQALLLSIKGCGVFGGASDSDRSGVMAQHTANWDRWIREGHLGRALQDLDAVEQITDAERQFIRVQLLHRAGLNVEALAEVRALLDSGEVPTASDRVRLAQICAYANGRGLARELLDPAIDCLEGQSDLEVALDVAKDFRDSALEERAAARLEALFPSSPGLIERRRRQLLAQGGYAELAQTYTPDAAHGAYRILAEGMAAANDAPPDYLGLIAAAPDATTAYWVRYLGFDDAMRRGLFVHAFALVKDEAKLPRFEVMRSRRLISALEAIFLRMGPKGTFLVPEAEVQNALVSLIRDLSHRPGDGALRAALADLFQPNVAGPDGHLLAILVLSMLAGQPINLVARDQPSSGSLKWLSEHQDFARGLFQWLAAEAPIVIGRLPAPSELVTASADSFVSSVARYIGGMPLGTLDDVQELRNWLAAGAAVTTYSVDTDYDLVLIRLAATRLATGGFPQAGRDLAEQAVINCGDSGWRRRLTWFALADTHHRAGNTLDAVLALGCVFACGGDVAPVQAFYETELLARIFRDAALIDWALGTVDEAREILSYMDKVDSDGQRLDTLELTIRQRAAAALPATDPAFEALISKALSVSRQVLEQDDQTGPMASMLSTALRRAREAGVAIPADAYEVLGALIAGTDGVLGGLLAAIAAETPSAEQLLSAVNPIDQTRYSDDAGFDATIPAFLAERSLVDPDFCADPVRVALALELLADRGVAVPGWDEAAQPPPPITAVEGPADMARALSRYGAAIVQAGWDESGQFIQLSTIAGDVQAVARAPQGQMTQAEFQGWAKTYPYKYGIDETTFNLFHVTTEALKWTGLPEGPLVFVNDVALQPYPPNIIRTGDSFIGRERAVAAAPSLAWLTAALARGRVGDGRRCAWISSAEQNGTTLRLLIQRFEGLFEDHGIALNSDERLPSDLAGASLAIVTAHGGVHPDGRFFQVVTDEGELRVSADDMANALRNIDLVILFVCSAGRADKHPSATTALGLAKRILDRGCSTVIASPWPLDSQVAGNWLEVFMRCWDAGETAFEANYQANRTVDGRFAGDPARGLAMTVYGNPFLTTP